MNSNSSAPRDPASDRKRIGVWENEGGGLDEQASEPIQDSADPRGGLWVPNNHIGAATKPQ